MGFGHCYITGMAFIL